MKRRRSVRIGLAVMAALALVATAVSPAYADSGPDEDFDLPPLSASRSQDVPQEYLVYPDGTPLPPGTRIMTDEEMEASEPVVANQLVRPQIKGGQRAAAGQVVGGCTLSIGRMWVRSSSRAEPFGGVGGKPKVTDCWGQVTKTYMQTFVWMHNGWIWFAAAGPSEARGSWNMEDKKVKYICKGTGEYPFRLQTYMRVMGPKDVVYDDLTGRSAEYKFKCG